MRRRLGVGGDTGQAAVWEREVARRSPSNTLIYLLGEKGVGMEKNWEGGESRGRSRVEWGKGDGGEKGREGGSSQGPEPGPACVHPYTQ